MTPEAYKDLLNISNDGWWSVGRGKVIDKILRCLCRQKIISKNISILDIGAGFNPYGNIYKKYGQFDLLELENYCVSYLKKNKNCRNLYTTKVDKFFLKKNKNKYDLLLTLDVIEHIKDDSVFLVNLNKILKNNGTLIATVPAFNFLWSSHDEKYGHFRRYRKNEFVNVLKKAGFKIKFVSYYNFFLFPLAFIKILLLKFTKKTDSKDIDTSSFTNTIFKLIFGFESHLLPNLKFPFGISIIAVVTK